MSPIYLGMFIHDGLTLASVPENYWLIVAFETWDSHVYDRYIPLKTGMTVVDVGASIGVFSLYAFQKVGPSGKVIAFEPEPISFSALVENVEFVNATNIISVNKGLYNESGTAKLNVTPGFVGSGFFNADTNTVDVRVERLDKILPDLGITHADFVKIDTEGAAMQILEGAEEILPYIDNFAIAAYHAPYEDPHQMEKFLQNHGFRTKITHHYGFIPYLYATRDPTIEFPTIETWQVVVAGGLGLFLLYFALKKK